MDVGNRHPAVLLECRDLMTSRLRPTVTRVVDEAALALERQTLGGTLSTPGSSSFDDVRELRQRRGELAVHFEHRFNEIFERRMLAPSLGGPGRAQVSAGCRSLLLEIDRRLEGLLRGTQLPSVVYLIEPDALIAAFDEACADVAAGDGVRRALRELFQRQVQLDLVRVYGEVNTLLVRRGMFEPRSVRREGAVRNEPFSTFPGRRPTVYSQGRSRAQHSVSEETLLFVRTLVNAHEVPYFVRAFALESWTRVMDRHRTEKGEDSAEWSRAVKTLEDLVNTVKMFGDVDYRRLAIWGLPGLIQRIKTGMASVNIPQQEQVLFLKTLRAHQLRVLGQRPAAASPFPPAEPDED